MNTPKLDALIQMSMPAGKGERGLPALFAEHAARCRCREIFDMYGPALVTVLKQVSTLECCCGDDSMPRCPICQSKTALAQIEQEAACQP